jgi:SAM-dependent methyltransferase
MAHYIDLPVNRKIDKPLVSIVGWITDKESCQEVTFRIGDDPVAFAKVDRPDVRKAFPGQHVLGFSVQLDFSKQPPNDASVTLKAVRRSQVLMSASFSVESELRSSCAEFATVRAANREWCLERLRCPLCATAKLRVKNDAIECGGCRVVFPQDSRTLNLLTPQLYADCSLKPTDNVSAHEYDREARAIIEEVGARGGKILDCGAGSRPTPHAAVVNLEVVDYPSTDILGVGQALPFRDGVFDAVFSLAVLEHVSNPFECASEMMRVLKHGGKIYAVVPFLQPEHGYPSHFYNMTRQGLVHLFKGMKIERHFVPPAGAPIWALHWMASEYANRLPEEPKQEFLSMTMRELLAKAPVDRLKDPIVTQLSEEGNWILACTTSIIATKPAGRS